ncbi:hypothetical protein CC2G_003661 [Coprinopsis cinerea AmutBmut pab1-1]|nr:hypothetical protein CC2G_003661 [Coprinopsis cinerea AmutBmut pab1-1]
MAYQAQPQMVVQQGGAGGNRNARNLPVGPDGREWSNGLFSCCNKPGTCFVATCFPCFTYQNVRSRYRHLNERGQADPSGGSSCGSDCCIHAILLGLGLSCFLQMVNRKDIRGRYNIRGGGCGDCCTAYWCGPCELVQEAQELELEEQSMGHAYAGKH